MTDLAADLAEETFRLAEQDRAYWSERAAHLDRVVAEIHRRGEQEANRRAWAKAYAGENPMKHYAKAGITKGGMEGCSQLFARLYSKEHAKHKAGEYLVLAREYRALGWLPTADKKLAIAQGWRRLAAERPSMIGE